MNVSQAKKTISDVRAAAAANGRDPQSLKLCSRFMPIIGKDAEDAKRKHEIAKEFADPVAGLAQFSGYTGIDLASFPLDELMDLRGMSQAMAIQVVSRALEASEGEEKQLWTPQSLGMRMALGGLHPCPVGTASEVADMIQEWIEEDDIDGCNIGSATNLGSWTDVVVLLVPELQRRGLYWNDYDVPGGTFRENLLESKELRDNHYGAGFKWKETSIYGAKRKREDEDRIDSGVER